MNTLRQVLALGPPLLVQLSDSPGKIEVDFHIDYNITVGENITKKITSYSHQHQKVGEEHNDCIVDDPQVNFCYSTTCNTELQKPVIEAALASSDPSTVARTIQRSINRDYWGIAVLKPGELDKFTATVNFLNGLVSLMNWCNIFIGINPSNHQPSYSLVIQLGKIIS
ncbi:unnamed protein product [Cylicocyclus nassatus]|uniref:Uncharacterized protein n=1 Tax=Cylicocyclus nassatus TaxID=53992 RepID=A0AA36DTP9_CYLNA|nr:unnamed protein product [Cylicocyclus nassatus]